MTPPLPDDAVTAAARYLERIRHSWIPATDRQREGYQAEAKGILTAAWPLLQARATAAERESILAALQEQRAILAYVTTDRHVEAVLWRDIADLLGGQP